LYLWPELTQITYYTTHVDENGHPCHGLLDESSVDQPLEDHPWLFNDMKQWVQSKLVLGMKPSAILDEHIQTIYNTEADGAYAKRDSYLKIYDIQNLAR
jgi:hypothetical protein